MQTRRDFLNHAAASAAGVALYPYSSALAQEPGVLVNDVHSQLNETRVARVVSVDSEAALREVIAAARREGRAISVAGAATQWAASNSAAIRC